ncbi:hypothetical protein MMC06_006806, partial [Schaereria dolodes]|nr:hypothetical protein [Schaereria dolodes]
MRLDRRPMDELDSAQLDLKDLLLRAMDISAIRRASQMTKSLDYEGLIETDLAIPWTGLCQ